MTGHPISRVVRACLRPLLVALLLPLLLVALSIQPVRAAVTIFVTTTNDDAPMPAPMNQCATDGITAPCTLRDAIVYADNNVGVPTIITLPAGIYTLTRIGNGENQAVTGDLDVRANVTITGDGAATTIIDGNGNSASPDRVFDVFPGGGLSAISVSISGVTIRNGDAVTSGGGGIFNSANATLTLTNCVVDSNTTTNVANGGGGIINIGASVALVNTTVSNNASGGDGGGIYNLGGGTVTVTNSIFSGNHADHVNGRGGGIYNNPGANPGTVTVTNSTFSGNYAAGNSGAGGGIENNGGTVTVTNSTFSSNSANYGGGGIYNFYATVTMTNSTVVGNHADGTNSTGGGIANLGTLTAINTLIAGNTAAGAGSIGPDVYLAFAAASKNNLLGDGSGSSGILDNDANHNIVGHPAMVDTTLRDNGGPTQTLALLPGSPAIDHGDDATCANTAGIAPVAGKDQRGIIRPQGLHCDIGAFESRGFTLAKTSGDGQRTTVGSPFAPLIITVTSANSEPVDGGIVTFTGPTTGAGIVTSPVTATIGATTTGQASITPTANGAVGNNYPVTAAVATGTTPASVAFTLSNTASPVASTTTLTASPNPSAAGQTVTFTATASGMGGTPTGGVTFKEGTTTLGGGTLFSGVATFSTAALSAGSHTITASYSGDATFLPSASPPLTQVVGTTLTSIAVTAPSVMIPVGGTTQFKATGTYADSSTADITASVTWASDTPAVATITTGGPSAGLATGVHGGAARITASLGAVVSPAVTLTVTGVPTGTTLASGPNPSTVGQTVTFTATVSGTGGTPTGTVTFKDGTITLGGATLGGGVAALTTAALAVGSHAITALYSGDGAFAASTSAPITQIVGPGALTSITVTATAATVAVGGTDQFTAACTYASGSPSDCTTAVTFASDTPNVATIASGGPSTGLASGVSAGTARITASLGGVTSPAVTLTVTGGVPSPAGGLQFYPLAKPVRLLDTRAGSTAFVAPNKALAVGQTLSLPGQFSYQGVTIPAIAQAIVGNATVANGSNGTPAGYATIFPSGVLLPLTSNLNFVPGTVRPNAFTVALGSDGKFNLYSSSGGDFVVDISGYYAPIGAGGLYFHPLTAPVRELDTRAGATAFVHPNAPLTAGQTLTLPGSFTYNSITVPASAKALVGNATVANGSNGTPAGFATLFPDDVPLPLASNLNFVPGTVAPNAFTVALGGGGGYKLYSSSGGDFVVDITGYLDTTAAGGLLFTPLTAPVRELDTRSGATAFVHPSATLTAGQTLTLPGSFTYTGITIPSSAQALVGNATVANDGNATPAGFATLYPDGVTLPLASNLNFVPQQVAPNAITVGIGSDGKYDLYSSSGGDFIIDITGYFAATPGGAAKPTGKTG